VCRLRRKSSSGVQVEKELLQSGVQVEKELLQSGVQVEK
jgi:hypothetical protein